MIELLDEFFTGTLENSKVIDLYPKAISAYKTLMAGTGKGNDFLGWLNLPENYDKKEFERIKNAAKRIKGMCDILIVIGIGGSYLGARAAIEFIKSPLYNNLKKDTPDIYFAGNNISTTQMNDLISICEGRDICINVISKSGTTTEPAIAFRIFKKMLIDKYGEEEAKKRIFVTTDKSRGTLKSFSSKAGYETFVIPDNIGGRYSVLTAVGLLPIACAGINIDELMLGARDAMNRYKSCEFDENAALRYAIYRNALYGAGKTTEILVGFEPYFAMLNEWWKQLYGESEGKEGKGIFPASVIFSTDLHSLGQYIQEGKRNIFETFIDVLDPREECKIPHDDANVDGLNFLSGKNLRHVNLQATMATLMAHRDGGVPTIVIQAEDKSAYTFGELVYFFEYACAISGYMLGVNPFDQPGVEAYKKNMFALLGKPGFEKAQEELLARINEMQSN